MVHEGISEDPGGQRGPGKVFASEGAPGVPSGALVKHLLCAATALGLGCSWDRGGRVPCLPSPMGTW